MTFFYLLQVEDEAVLALMNCRDDHNITNFDQFHFSPRSIPYLHMPCYVLKMFRDLGFIDHWKIKRTTLAR